jgi:hypothetical protein
VKEHVINNAVGKSDEIASTKILLDNQADISILQPSLLSDVREAEALISVGGYQMEVRDALSCLKSLYKLQIMI